MMMMMMTTEVASIGDLWQKYYITWAICVILCLATAIHCNVTPTCDWLTDQWTDTRPQHTPR